MFLLYFGSDGFYNVISNLDIQGYLCFGQTSEQVYVYIAQIKGTSEIVRFMI